MKKQIHPKTAYQIYSVRFETSSNRPSEKWSYYEAMHIQDAVVSFLKEQRPFLDRENYNIVPLRRRAPDIFYIDIDYSMNFLTGQKLYQSTLSPDNFLLGLYIEAKPGRIKNLTKLDKLKVWLKDWLWN